MSINLESDDESQPVERQRSVDTASPSRRRRRGRKKSDVVKVITALSTLLVQTKVREDFTNTEKALNRGDHKERVVWLA